jgi:TrmH family RNA methyltransferase
LQPSAPVIRSRSNPAVRRFRSLKQGGPDADLLLIEGTKLLEEALAADARVVEVAATPAAATRPRVAALLASLRDRRVPVRLLDEDVLASLSEAETSQGVLALARRPTFAEDAPFRGVPLVVVGVALQNPGNLGGLIRTAEAAGATGAFFTEGSADPMSWKALRGSMGSAFRLPHVGGLSLRELGKRLRARGIALVATVAEGGEAYDQARLDGPLALFFGNEGSGLPEGVLAGADRRLRIPLAGRVDSLNVGVAAGVVLFEAARQRRRAAEPEEVARA